MSKQKILIQRIVLLDGKSIAVAKSVAIATNNGSTSSQVVVKTSNNSSSSRSKSSSSVSSFGRIF